MKTSTVLWIVLAVIVVGGGIYLLATQNSMNMAATSTATTTMPAAAPTLTMGNNAQFPTYLAASNGMVLYTFNKDTSGMSNCTGTCATAWPPYTVTSATGLTAGANIPGTISTITRADGTMQVTYNGMPLYFFAKDTSVGQVTGNGDDGFSVAMTQSTQAAASATTPASGSVAPTAPTRVSPPMVPQTAPSAPAYNY